MQGLTDFTDGFKRSGAFAQPSILNVDEETAILSLIPKLQSQELRLKENLSS